jgi:hypothetical protein
MPPPTIAVLGWGSLIWDERPDFDQHHEPWQLDGPLLPIEFARVSRTRLGALTLILDTRIGTVCQVAYAKSKRKDPQDAICDLRTREGTTRKNVGYYFTDGSAKQAREPTILDTVAAWARLQAIDCVIWTDLQSNFEAEVGTSFCVSAAVEYIESLSHAGKAAAASYVRQAPLFVVTPLRIALQTRPWFQNDCI